MLTLSGSLRVFLALEPCDMRKSFDGLHALVVTRLGDDPDYVADVMGRFFLHLMGKDITGDWEQSSTADCGIGSEPGFRTHGNPV